MEISSQSNDISNMSIENIIIRLSNNYTKIIHCDELTNLSLEIKQKNKSLVLKGNGTGDRWANKKYNYTIIYKKNIRCYSENEDDVIPQEILTIFQNENKDNTKYKGTSAIGIYVHSNKKDTIKNDGRNIRKDIKLFYKKKSCVVCGCNSDLCCDHKNDFYNDPRVLNMETQELSDFQSLCRHCNLQKRQICKNEIKNKKLYSAKEIDQFKIYPFNFYWEEKEFDLKDPNNKKDTYWYDPIEFNRKILLYIQQNIVQSQNQI